MPRTHRLPRENYTIESFKLGESVVVCCETDDPDAWDCMTAKVSGFGFVQDPDGKTRPLVLVTLTHRLEAGTTNISILAAHPTSLEKR